MYRNTKHACRTAVLCMVLVLGPAVLPAAATTLDGDLIKPGEPIVITDDLVLGTPATITLDTSGGGSTWADITVFGPVEDDAFNTTGLILKAGAGGNVDLQGGIGNVRPPASLTIESANQVTLATATTEGAVDLTAGAVTTGGPVLANNGPVNLNAPAIVLNGGLATGGNAITINGNLVLGAPAVIALDTTNNGAAPAGADIAVTGTIDDDVATASALVLTAGSGGHVNLQGVSGGAIPPAGLTVVSADVVDLAATTASGAVSVTANTLNVNGPIQTAGANVTLNATTITLKDKIQTAGGAVSGTTATTVNVRSTASIQNAVDIAAGGATLYIDAATYGEDVSAGTAMTMRFSGDTRFDLGLSVTSSLALAADDPDTLLRVGSLSISDGGGLDVADLLLCADGDVETTLDDWILDGRLFSSTAPTLDAVYQSALDRTEVVPEPATVSLLVAGGLALLCRRRRQAD